jgi:guanylate kinase
MQSWDSFRRRDGLVVVLSGPSGVGKDRVLAEFVQRYPDVHRCVTVTTRPPRSNEEAGKDYTFVSVQDFRRMVEEGQFLEFAEVYGNLYGSPKSWVAEQVAAGRDVVLKIDVQGGILVKRQMPEALMIFLLPPSLEELERRLRDRLTDSDADITKRLLEARRELEQISYYEYAIENDSIEKAVSELRAVIIAERNRIITRR